MDFKNAEELLQLCEEENLSIADMMRKREQEEGGVSASEVEERMKTALEIMYNAAHEPLEKDFSTMGSLIGGEAKKLDAHRKAGRSICGSLLSKAAVYSQAVLEVNASMGLIVAAPTAGSSGVIPAVLFALAETSDLGEKRPVRRSVYRRCGGIPSHAECLRIRCGSRLPGRNRLRLGHGGSGSGSHDGRNT